jgi:GAF domain-containing protein
MRNFDAQPGRVTELSSAQKDADEIDLLTGLRGLAGLIGGARDALELQCQVAEFAAEAIPGVDGSGVSLINEGKGLPVPQTASATAGFVHEIDSFQYSELGEGPCITCIETQRPTVSGSLGSDSRWPRFGGRVARMGVHSALSLPLMVDDHLIGVLNCYARSHDAFGEHAVQLGTQFAEPAAVSIYNAELLAGARARADKLQEALDNRAVIDQAIGIIRSRTGGSADEAFQRLAQISQKQNVKLQTVAERLVDEAARRATLRRAQ